MITVVSPKNFPESPKEDEKGNHTKEDNETVEPTQAPPTFEEGGHTAQYELLEINLGSNKEPWPKFINDNMSHKEKGIYLKFLK